MGEALPPSLIAFRRRCLIQQDACAPNNPMGVAALTLSAGDYAIRGTNWPGSIGTFASYGCIRMYNEHIAHLFTRVNVGTPVEYGAFGYPNTKDFTPPPQPCMGALSP
jgi:hypothetical protein